MEISLYLLVVGEDLGAVLQRRLGRVVVKFRLIFEDALLEDTLALV